MNLFKKELEKEKDSFTAIEFKNERKNLRELKQVGSSDKKRDASRKALTPGKRISKDGNIYWETRKNRSDTPGSKI